MRDELTVRVPTPQLQKLLEGAPDVLLKLETHACEKIAEEITAKVARRSASIDQEIGQRTERVIQDQLRRLNSTYDMPSAALKAIDEVANRRIDKEIKAISSAQSGKFQKEVEDAVKRITKSRDDAATKLIADVDAMRIDAQARLKNQIWEARQALEEELRHLVREEARTAFIDVLRDVKNGTVGIF